jgi:hypothetical protein
VIESPNRPTRAKTGSAAAQRRPSAGRARLVLWTAGRVLWILLVAVWAGGIWTEGPDAYPVAAFMSLLAALVLASGILRLHRMIRAGRDDSRVPAWLRSSGRMVLADHVLGGPSLEWRVLRWQPRVSGDVHILGPAEPGRWLVVQLADGRPVWPRTRAQVVIGTAAPKLPDAILRDEGPQADAHRLLAGYVQTVRLAADLPLVVRRPPGPSTTWWRLGALRPVVRTLVLLRLRRRLTVLANALVHQAMQTGGPGGARTRRRLVETSQDCRALAASLPRLAWLAVAATAGTAALTILGPLVPWSELSKLIGHMNHYLDNPRTLEVALACLAFAVVPLLVLSHSVSCAQALLSPAAAIPRWADAHEATWLRADWDVLKLETDAFTSAGTDRPTGSWRWLRWVTGAVYGLALGYSVVHWRAWWALAWLGAAVVVYALSRWRRGWMARRLLRAQSRGGPPRPGP